MHHRLSRFHLSLLISAVWMVVIIMACDGWVRVAALASLVVLQSGITALGVVRPQWQFFGPVLSRGPKSLRRVALTFDDGPDPAITPRLLDLLHRRGIVATFFCVGARVKQHPDICRRAQAEGHELENHSLNHHRWTNFFSRERLRAEVDAGRAALLEATGCAPRHFRPPMGLTNGRVFRVATQLGLRVVGWTLRGRDQRACSAEEVVSRLIPRMVPGAIVLLHDGDNEPERLLRTVEMLVDKLGAEGYQCVRLDTLLNER